MKRVTFAILAVVICSQTQAKYSGGSGESNNPYQIATPEDLNNIGNHIEDFNSNFVMVNDINLSAYTGTQFNMIGSETEHFRGVFDGNGHSIYNFTYVNSYMAFDVIGLFRYVNDPNACITNLGLIKPYFECYQADYGSAFLVYNLMQGQILNCFVEDGFFNAGDDSGGLVGINSGTIKHCSFSGFFYTGGGLVYDNRGTIEDCFVNCSSEYANSCGGFAYSNGGTIERCFSSGKMGAVSYWGGFARFNGGLIRNCYSTVDQITDVLSPSHNAGFVVYNGESGVIANCYSTGYVRSGTLNRGFISENYGTVLNSFWDVNTSHLTNSAAGTGKTTVEMQTKSTFTDAGWDFVWETVNGTEDIWAICEGVTYPKLDWQFTKGDSDNDKDVDFEDFAVMGEKWQQADSTLYCGGIDLTGDEWIDLDDLAIFCQNWLTGL